MNELNEWKQNRVNNFTFVALAAVVFFGAAAAFGFAGKFGGRVSSSSVNIKSL